MKKIEIIEYHPSLKNYFSDINYAWIKKYFVIEEMDRKMLNDPEEYILKKEGHILFARYENKIVGTVALIKKGEKIVELAKMGVDEEYQGKGIGKKLIEAAIQKAKKTGFQTIFLVSNTILQTAISLYKKMGFVEVPFDASKSGYDRCDIKMELFV